MGGWLLRRLAGMALSFALILVLLFGLLALAPEPVPPDAVGATMVDQESLADFRRQNGLDLPVFLNLRWRWTQADVAAALRADRTRVLRDGGRYLVPHLVALLDDPELGPAALAALPAAASLDPVRGDEVETRRRAELERRMRGADASAWRGFWAENQALYAISPLRDSLLHTRFARWTGNLLRLDLGRSMSNQREVSTLIAERLPRTVLLSFSSILLAWSLSVPLGVWTAAHAGSPAERGLSLLVFFLYSLPSFFLAILLLGIFAEGEPWQLLPPGGFDSGEEAPPTTLGRLLDVGRHLLLPVATATGVSLAVLSRYARAGVIELIRADFVRTARAKGLSELEVMVKHAARNGMLPVLTLLSGVLPGAVSGNVVVETVYNIPGVGSLFVEAVVAHDYAVVMGVLLVTSALTLVGILLSDLAYAWADPRIRLA